MATGTPDSPAEPSRDEAIPRIPWQTGVAANYITLFLWVAFYDQLAPSTLAVGGLIPSLLGAVVAGLLCYLLLYNVPAMWGLKTRRPLAVVGTSTFGAAGAAFVPGLLMGVVQVVWFAVATRYAATFCLEALANFDLIEPGRLEPWSWSGLRLESPLYLITTLVWIFAFAMVGSWFWRLVTAIMRVFPIAPALVLAAAMLWAIPGLADFRPQAIGPAPVGAGGPRAFLMMIQLVFGFFATAGAEAADWGMACRDARDVRLGGWVGVALGSIVLATLALLTVAGALGRGAAASTIEGVLWRGIGGPAGGVMLMILALGSMATAVYASHVFGERFAAAWPRLSRPSWTFLGAAASYPLLATGAAGKLATLFSLLGAAFAPVVGAMAADALRHRGAWPGPRRGVSAAGLGAWGVGVFVGVLPMIGRAARWGAWSQVQPAAVLAFVAGFVVYLVLARLGLEPAAAPAEVPHPPDDAERLSRSRIP